MIYSSNVWQTFSIFSLFGSSLSGSGEQSIEAITAQARRTASEASAYLCTPLRGCDALGVVTHVTPLIAWGSCNPNGPTTSSLSLVPTRRSKERLLMFRVHTPFSTTGVVFGLVPNRLNQDPSRMYRTLEMLFQRNGSSEFPLISSLPTHVPAIPQSPLSQAQVKALVMLAAQRAQCQDNPSKLAEPIERLSCDQRPWSVLEAAEASQVGSGLRVAQSELGVDAWERWWSLVSDERHVISEVRQLLSIWQCHVLDSA